MDRRTVLKQLAAIGGLAIAGAASSAQAQAAEPFTTLPEPIPSEAKGKIEVIEFFHYGCPHCRNFDPPLTEWLKTLPSDVAFRRVPAIWGDAKLKGLAQLFYAMEVVGALDKNHQEVFPAVQSERLPLHTPAGAEAWIQRRGGDVARFKEAYASFGVQSKVQRADQLARLYRIEGVPTLAIGGRYLVTGEGGETLKLADQLIARVRKDAKP